MSPQQRALVREAFAELKAPGNEWVGLADIREKLESRGLNREQQDAAFRDMLSRDSDVRIIPVANTKALKPRDHLAAFELGGSPVHAMSIREENRRSQSVVREPVESNRSEQEIRIELEALRDQLRVTTDAQQRKALEQRISQLVPPGGQATAENVRAAYHGLAASPGEWVSLTRLRAELAARGIPRAEQDDAIRELARTNDVNLVPENNQKTLTDADRAASIRFGGQDKHLIAVGVGESLAPGRAAQRLQSASRVAVGRDVPSDVPPGSTPAEQSLINAYWTAVREKGITGTDKWVRLSDIRPALAAMGLDRAEQDAAIESFALRRDARLVPVENLKSMTAADHAARVTVGGQPKDAILMYTPTQFAPQSRAAQRLSAQGSDLDAKRQQLAQLEAAAASAPRTQEKVRLDFAADELRQEIKHANDAGTVDQPRETTRADVMRVYAELARHPGDLVSLVRLRGSLPHIKHGELTAVLKEMDRERLIQLDPDSNRKALPPEAHEAAVMLGGEPKHFIHVRGVGGGSGGRAAQRLRGTPKA